MILQYILTFKAAMFYEKNKNISKNFPRVVIFAQDILKRCFAFKSYATFRYFLCCSWFLFPSNSRSNSNFYCNVPQEDCGIFRAKSKLLAWYFPKYPFRFAHEQSRTILEWISSFYFPMQVLWIIVGGHFFHSCVIGTKERFSHTIQSLCGTSVDNIVLGYLEAFMLFATLFLYRKKNQIIKWNCLKFHWTFLEASVLAMTWCAFTLKSNVVKRSCCPWNLLKHKILAKWKEISLGFETRSYTYMCRCVGNFSHPSTSRKIFH